MVAQQEEKLRGDKWALKQRNGDAWVEKLQPPPTGLPDWLLVHRCKGTILIEAKTLEAVMAAEEQRPIMACSGAQRFVLRMIHEHGGCVGMVILGAQGYVNLGFADAREPMTLERYQQMESSY
jgi:hypothetical protein